jgi:hypothetical protein
MDFFLCFGFLLILTCNNGFLAVFYLFSIFVYFSVAIHSDMWLIHDVEKYTTFAEISYTVDSIDTLLFLIGCFLAVIVIYFIIY